jgi:hypothetical protein
VSACSWPQLQWSGLFPAKRDRLLHGAAPLASRDEANACPVGFQRHVGTATPLRSQVPAHDLVIIVTPATSISFFRPEFDDFLHAPIGMESNEMLLSVLSALARLNLDPWMEAAELSELPTDCATQRLAGLIVRLPGGRWTPADSWRIAHRLIELLPRRSSPDVPLAEKAHGIPRLIGSPVARLLICAALAGVALISVARCEPSSGADMVSSRMTGAAPHRP